MAKIKFGSGLELKVEEPNVGEESPKTGNEAPQPDIMSMLTKAMELLPKPKEIEHQDLGYLERAISSQGSKLLEHNDRLVLLEKAEKSPAPVAQLALPEVKQITHVKDVSAEVMEHVEANRQANKADYMNHANHIVAIESALTGQKILNVVLVLGLIVLTILHFK